MLKIFVANTHFGEKLKTFGSKIGGDFLGIFQNVFQVRSEYIKGMTLRKRLPSTPRKINMEPKIHPIEIRKII